jgi:hypothetical protein
MSYLNRALLLLLFIVFGAGALQGQRSFGIYEEDDLSAGDRTYTNGIRFTWVSMQAEASWMFRHFRAVAPLPRDSAAAVRIFSRLEDSAAAGSIGQPFGPCSSSGMARSLRPCGIAAFSIGQAMYTPRDLLSRELHTDDRPFAGYLYVAVSRTAVLPRDQVTSEVNIGVTGKPALARNTQAFAHWALVTSSPQPQGWGNQLRFTPHINLINTYQSHLVERCKRGTYWRFQKTHCDGTDAEKRVFDVTPRVELVAGTMMTRASLGATIRAGYRVPDVNGVSTIPVGAPPTGAPRKKFCSTCWLNFFGTADGRLIHHNALVTGTPWADSGPDGWRTLNHIKLRHSLTEWAVGLTGGSADMTVSAQAFWRGPELSPNDARHRVFSIFAAINRP